MQPAKRTLAGASYLPLWECCPSDAPVVYYSALSQRSVTDMYILYRQRSHAMAQGCFLPTALQLSPRDKYTCTIIWPTEPQAIRSLNEFTLVPGLAKNCAPAPPPPTHSLLRHALQVLQQGMPAGCHYPLSRSNEYIHHNLRAQALTEVRGSM